MLRTTVDLRGSRVTTGCRLPLSLLDQSGLQQVTLGLPYPLCMRALLVKWRAWQANPDWLTWQRLSLLPPLWLTATSAIGICLAVIYSAIREPSLGPLFRFLWLAVVAIGLVVVFVFRRRLIRSYTPPVHFPPPPKHKRRRFEIGRGVSRAAEPGVAIAAIYIQVVAVDIVFSIGEPATRDSTVLDVAVQVTAWIVLAVGAWLGVVFYRLGVREYRTSIDKLLYPETKRAAELREKMEELAASARGAESLVQEVAGLQQQLVDVISLRQANIDELIKLEQERQGAASLQADQLDVLFDVFDKKGARGRRRALWFDVILSLGSVILGLLLSAALPPDAISQLLHLRPR